MSPCASTRPTSKPSRPRNFRRHDQADQARLANGVAVINVTGPIVRYADTFSAISGATSVDTLARDFATALADPAVDSILLNIDSPGGEVAGINEVAQMVFEARGKKPICAYVDHMACSAAYWIASAADEIVTDATGMLGSIGVVMVMPNPDARSARDVQFVSSQSPKKRPNPNTESGREQIQGTVDALAEVFIAAVARNRGRSSEQVVAEFGQGGVFVGQQAVDAGLADRLGNFETTLAEMAAKAKQRRPTMRVEEENDMSMLEDIKARVMSAIGAAFDDERPAAASVAETPAPTVDGSIEERDREIAAAQQQLLEAKLEAAEAGIERFLAEQFAAERFLPAERPALREALLQAAADDLALPRAGESRVAQLQALVTTRPAHNLTKEVVADDGTLFLPADENAQTEAMTASRRRQLLEMTPLGAAALHVVK